MTTVLMSFDDYRYRTANSNLRLLHCSQTATSIQLQSVTNNKLSCRTTLWTLFCRTQRKYTSKHN